MPRQAKPKSNLPEVGLYVWTNKGQLGQLEAVLCFRRHINPQLVTTALQRAMNRSRREGELAPTLTFRQGHVVLVHGAMTPGRLLDKAKLVARFMGYSTKMVPPPSYS